jgi:hypothetical protein
MISRNYNGPERRSMARRLWMLFVSSDLAMTRFLLGLGATFVACGMWADQSCQYASCVLLESLFPWQAWAVLWSIYSVGKFCRLFGRERKPRISLAINVLGAFLYGAFATGLTMARWPHAEGAAFTDVMAVASLWVLARTAAHEHDR